MSDRVAEIHINMQGRVIVRYEGGKCVDVTDTRGRKLYAAQAQAGDGEAEYGRGYYDGRKSNIDQVPEFWYEALEKIAQEYEELFIYYKDEREKDGWDSPEYPQTLLEVRELLKGFNPAPPPAAVNQQLLELQEDLDETLRLLADWAVAVMDNGAGWDYWDDYYKETMYGNLRVRKRLDAFIAETFERDGSSAAIAAAQEAGK